MLIFERPSPGERRRRRGGAGRGGGGGGRGRTTVDARMDRLSLVKALSTEDSRCFLGWADLKLQVESGVRNGWYGQTSSIYTAQERSHNDTD